VAGWVYFVYVALRLGEMQLCLTASLAAITVPTLVLILYTYAFARLPQGLASATAYIVIYCWRLVWLLITAQTFTCHAHNVLNTFVVYLSVTLVPVFHVTYYSFTLCHH